MIDAAAEAGVERIVKLSAINAQADSPLPPFAWHGAIKRHLNRSGVRAVVLRAGFFMANLLMLAEGVAAAGQLFAPAGDGRVAMVHPADVAAAAAALLMSGGHAGGCYELTGGEAINFVEVATTLAAAATVLHGRWAVQQRWMPLVVAVGLLLTNGLPILLGLTPDGPGMLAELLMNALWFGVGLAVFTAYRGEAPQPAPAPRSA